MKGGAGGNASSSLQPRICLWDIDHKHITDLVGCLSLEVRARLVIQNWLMCKRCNDLSL